MPDTELLGDGKHWTSGSGIKSNAFNITAYECTVIHTTQLWYKLAFQFVQHVESEVQISSLSILLLYLVLLSVFYTRIYILPELI